MTFEYCISRVGINEGGLSKDPHDRGNWTSGKVGVGVLKGSKFGFSAMSFPDIDFDHFEWPDAMKLAKTRYWDKYRIGEMAPHIRLMVLDSVINHETNGIRILKRAIGGLSNSATVGPLTIAGSFKATPRAFALARGDFYVDITQNGFNDDNDREQLKGWIRRNTIVLCETMEWIAKSKTTV